ncbi:MAG: hypothetical protein QOI76_62, partial [Frankiales bacterium]|nr:hypothetical protein [Frankiales bacterium]
MHRYSLEDDVIARALAEACLARLAMDAPLDFPQTP